MTKPKILIVDDDPRVVVFVVDQLEHLGYQVLVARDGKQGLIMAQTKKPDLIVLDVMMPEMNGYQVCHRLKSASETEHIPILMLTAKGQIQDKVRGFDKGADDYLPKPYDRAEFEARVKALLKRSMSPPYDTRGNCVFLISCRPDHRIGIRLSGTVTCNATTRRIFDLDTNVYARQSDNVPRLDWRFNSKQIGKQLHQCLFVNHPKVLGNYHQALGESQDDEKLHFRIESSRDFLRVPFEFLFGSVHADGDYLALRHPLARCITDLHVKRSSLSSKFLNGLWAKGEALKILLIASNTKPVIPGVDYEIEALDDLLKALFDDKGILTWIKALPTAEATYEKVRKELQKCEYHIVHYAGHGYYDKQSSEKSCLYFWEKPNRQGKIIEMPVSELQILLRGGELRFAYLSCCLGTKVGESTQLLDDDFLGIADGVTQAGVPSVLGFRWPVSDDGAKELAVAFYRSLAEQGRLDTALLQARCHVAAKNRDDITWLSPILLMQA